jgi:hypothetical protein
VNVNLNKRFLQRNELRIVCWAWLPGLGPLGLVCWAWLAGFGLLSLAGLELGSQAKRTKRKRLQKLFPKDNKNLRSGFILRFYQQAHWPNPHKGHSFTRPLPQIRSSSQTTPE